MTFLKYGVSIQGMRPEMLLGVMVAIEAYRERGYDTVITSATDGKHSATSLHYAGCAVDLRTKHLEDPQEAEDIAGQLRRALAPHFDVVVEPDHIHLEYQPRRPINAS